MHDFVNGEPSLGGLYFPRTRQGRSESIPDCRRSVFKILKY